MFTIDAIAAAHKQVKSGADFPAFIQQLKLLGVVNYQTFVTDGHTVYSGANNFKTESPAKYEALQIADSAHPDTLKHDLKAHQQGGSDYFTFCRQAAAAGNAYWITDVLQMTCTYYDTAGNEILKEQIPG